MIRRLFIALGACAAFAGTSQGALAFSPPPFPRLAGINIGSPQNYNDPTYEANLAKLSFSILSMYPTFQPGGMTMDQVVKAIKAINPNTLVFLYVNENEQATTGGVFASFQQKLDQMHWWLYVQGCSGATVPSTYGNGEYILNNSLYTPKDSSGMGSVDWMTQYFVQTYYGAAPSSDGFFMDNVFWEPEVDGDWNCSGTTELHTSAFAGTALRQGYQHYFSVVRTLMPAGKYQLGNIGDWGDATTAIPEYQNMADGGVLEAYIGNSWSYETWAGWQATMTRYHTIMGMINQPKLLIFNAAGSVTDYQTMRYALASSLMDDAYFSYTDNSVGYSSVPWFDEYNANLGAAITSPQTAAWQKGVYRRDFANGIALVNPKGNGAQTVTLETSFVKLKGTQAPSVNDGSTVTQVTLQDRDGIILMRNSGRKPNPPTQISVAQ